MADFLIGGRPALPLDWQIQTDKDPAPTSFLSFRDLLPHFVWLWGWNLIKKEKWNDGSFYVWGMAHGLTRRLLRFPCFGTSVLFVQLLYSQSKVGRGWISASQWKKLTVDCFWIRKHNSHQNFVTFLRLKRRQWWRTSVWFWILIFVILNNLILMFFFVFATVTWLIWWVSLLDFAILKKAFECFTSVSVWIPVSLLLFFFYPDLLPRCSRLTLDLWLCGCGLSGCGWLMSTPETHPLNHHPTLYIYPAHFTTCLSYPVCCVVWQTFFFFVLLGFILLLWTSVSDIKFWVPRFFF